MDSRGDDHTGQPTTGEREKRRARCRQSSRRATKWREGHRLKELQSQIREEEVAHQGMLPENYRLSRMSYDDIR